MRRGWSRIFPAASDLGPKPCHASVPTEAMAGEPARSGSGTCSSVQQPTRSELTPAAGPGTSLTYYKGPKNYQYPGPSYIVAYTSNRPQHDLGNDLVLCCVQVVVLQPALVAFHQPCLSSMTASKCSRTGCCHSGCYLEVSVVRG